ncbi:MAG: hypothetical protein IJM27_07145 [Eubacterium sp.]|nr:hypothetical protein [Eubacterium sp.]
MRRKIACVLIGAMLACMTASHVAASEPGEKASRFPADAASEPRLEWVQNITEDNADGEYFTKKLGMDRVTRQSVLRTIEENWTEGLMYNLSAYTIDHTNAAECTNNGSEQYAGRVRKNYGYNCTGFVASVLYYANGGSRENALENMNELYMPLKKAGGRGSMRSFTDGTGWYYFAAGRGEEALDGSPEKKTKIYSLGETRGPEDLQAILNNSEAEGKLLPGYILYFWPSSGWDCHIAIYAGKDSAGVHQMYHAAGRGNHYGVYVPDSIALSQATSEGASYVYSIPLPEALTGWQKVDGMMCHFYGDGTPTLRWYKENGNWYYFDPDTGALCTGLKHIGDKTYFFFKDGRMARYIMFGRYIFDKNGYCIRIE